MRGRPVVAEERPLPAEERPLPAEELSQPAPEAALAAAARRSGWAHNRAGKGAQNSDRRAPSPEPLRAAGVETPRDKAGSAAQADRRARRKPAMATG